MDNKSRVLEALKKSEKPLKAAQLVEMLEMKREDVDKAFKELKAEGKIISPKPCFYTVA